MKTKQLNKRAEFFHTLMGVVLAIVLGYVLLVITGKVPGLVREGEDIKACGNMPGTYCFEDTDCRSYEDQYMPTIKGCKGDEPFCCLTFKPQGPNDKDAIDFFIISDTGDSYRLSDGQTTSVSGKNFTIRAEIMNPDELFYCKLSGDLGSTSGIVECPEDKPATIERKNVYPGEYDITLDVYDADKDDIKETVEAKIKVDFG